MNWIFPMAGKGTRTSTLGDFKPFIQIGGKPMVELFFESIRQNILDRDKIVAITTKEFNDNYNFEESIIKIARRSFSNVQVGLLTVLTEKIPPGPAATTYYAKNYINDGPCAVVNCDQWIDFSLPEKILKKHLYLPTYCNFHSRSSYVEIVSGKIERIVEKQNISNIASAGVYIVSNGSDLMNAIEQHVKEDIGEYFVGPALNYLLKSGYTGIPIEVKAKYDLGNIEGIDHFKKVRFV